MGKLWPLILVIMANTFYNIAAREIPQSLDPFFSLTFAYFIAMLISGGLYFVYNPIENLVGEFAKLDWFTLLFGLCIIGLEYGYIYIYRTGWKISIASLVSNIVLAVFLLLVGLFLYKEQITFSQAVGMVLCLIGLILIGR
ncbi:MAG: EamA family transporter [Phascolarctobacterium sp.]|nr:EamA family transporter [Candidatus Phascolarctobacterium caballi]